MVDDQMTLGQLNEKYWYNIRSDYSVFSVQDIIEAIRLKIKPHIPSERLIYYKVDYSQIKTVMWFLRTFSRSSQQPYKQNDDWQHVNNVRFASNY